MGFKPDLFDLNPGLSPHTLPFSSPSLYQHPSLPLLLFLPFIHSSTQVILKYSLPITQIFLSLFTWKASGYNLINPLLMNLFWSSSLQSFTIKRWYLLYFQWHFENDCEEAAALFYYKCLFVIDSDEQSYIDSFWSTNYSWMPTDVSCIYLCFTSS